MSEEVQVVRVIALAPCRVWAEKDFLGTVHIKMQHEGAEEFDFVQIQYDYRYTGNSHQAWLSDEILKLLGASDSGTEPQ